jgi:hypothetical protein
VNGPIIQRAGKSTNYTFPNASVVVFAISSSGEH